MAEVDYVANERCGATQLGQLVAKSRAKSVRLGGCQLYGRLLAGTDENLETCGVLNQGREEPLAKRGRVSGGSQSRLSGTSTEFVNARETAVTRIL